MAEKRTRRTYDKEQTIQFFRELDEILDREIELVLVGGTALILQDLKTETKDFEFFVNGIDYYEFETILEKLETKYDLRDIDFWMDGVMLLHKGGRIVERKMPEDYRTGELSLFQNVKIKFLNPLDIIATKLDRYDQKDVKDVTNVIKRHFIKKEDLEERCQYYIKNYDGSTYRYISHIKDLVEDIFPDNMPK